MGAAQVGLSLRAVVRVLTPGSLWSAMDAERRRRPTELTRADVPVDPGVYAWYRDGAAIYVGKATSLQQRVWGNHLGRGRAMTSSAFRRNVADHLNIAAANAIKTKAYVPTDADVLAVRNFIEGCAVAWLVCDNALAAVYLEKRMKNEWMPRLTRM